MTGIRLVLMLLLALLSVLVVAAAGASSSSLACPSSPPNPKGQQSCRVLILGGGPGGLFSAYLLRDLGRDVCVVEKTAVWDGRMQDYPGPPTNDGTPPPVFGTCGLRVNEAQKDMRCLAHDLNVTLEESNFDNAYQTRGTWSRSTEGLLGDAAHPGVFKLAAAANFSSTDLESELFEYALLGKPVNPLTGAVPKPHPSTRCANYASVREYLVDVVGGEAAAFLLASSPLRSSIIYPLDVCAYLDEFKAEWGRCCTDFYPRGGWSAIHGQIRAKLVTAGVRMIKDSPITCLYRVQVPGSKGQPSSLKYVALKADRSGWTADRLIVTGGPLDVKVLGGALGAKLASATEVNSIQPIEVAVYNAWFPKRFWARYLKIGGRNFRVVTDVHCTGRSEFPDHPYVRAYNASRPIYVDNPACVNEWRAIYAAGGLAAVRSHAMAIMSKMFPGETIPQPTSDLFYIRPNSWHFIGPYATRKNVTVDSLKAWAKAPFGDPSLCMVGEPYYSRGAGWADGAWQSAVSCLSQSSWSKLTKNTARWIKHYQSGCEGAKTFSNEVFAIEKKLPGIMPGDTSPFKPAAFQALAEAATLDGVVETSNVDNSERQRYRP